MRSNHASKLPPHLLKDDAESHAKHLKLTQCKICQYYVPHDSYCITQHLIIKHKAPSSPFERQVINYLALPESLQTRNRLSKLKDSKLSGKCSVIMRTSEYVQYIKDGVYRNSVECVLRKNLQLRKYSIGALCFRHRNQKLPVLPTFEIGDLCSYKCRKCQLKITRYKKLMQHEPKCVGIRNLRDSRLLCAYIQEARYHQCRICDTIILCDTEIIANHVLKSHGIKIEDYMFKIPRKFTQKALVPISHPIINNLQLNATEQEVIPKESITFDARNLCNFECDKCFYRSNSYSRLKTHLMRCKGSRKFHRKLVIDAIFHECKICGVLLLCDRLVLSYHVSQTHNMRMRAYDAVSMLQSEHSMKKLSEKEDSSFSTKSKFRSTTEDRSLVHSVPPLDKLTNPRESLPHELTTNKVGNFCLFACNQCTFKSFRLGGMRSHNKRTGHGSGTAKFDKKFVKEAKYHKCVICAVIILCETHTIMIHVKDKHGLTLATYINKYCNLGSKPQNQLKQNLHDGKDKSQKEVEIVSQKFINLCLFECDKCNTKLGSWKQLVKHFKICKKSNFCKNFDERYIIKKVLHKCFICEKTMLCDKHKMVGHISSQHNLTGSEYITMIDNANKSNQPRIKIRQVQDDNKEMDIQVSVFTSNLAKFSFCYAIPQDYLDSSNMTSYVSNLCIFSCVHCDFQVNRWSDMSAHIQKTQHKVNGNLFDGDYVLEAVYHKCYICAKGILCDEELIRNHIRGAHKIFLLSNYKNDSKNTTRNSIKFKSKKHYHKKLRHELSGDQMMTKAVNACMFACDKCSYVHKSYFMFRRHKRKQHGDEKFKFDLTYLRGIHYYFQCPLCEVCVLCDRALIFNHVTGHKFVTMGQFDHWCAENAHETKPSK